MGEKASRVGDHAEADSGMTRGVAEVGAPDVQINGRSALRTGDNGTGETGFCAGRPWDIITGAELVKINGMLMVRVGDVTDHHACGPGKMTDGSPDVLVGGRSKRDGWTVDDLKENLDNCDSTGAWAKAKAANGGKDPIVKKEPSVIGSGGSVNTSTGTISLDPRQDKCNATQVLVQELTNLSHKQDFEKANADAAAGNVSRNDYIRSMEKPEYDGVRQVINAHDSCKATWGCSTCEKDWARKYTTFDDYYNHALGNDHKEFYGKRWDKEYSAAYKAKHP